MLSYDKIDLFRPDSKFCGSKARDKEPAFFKFLMVLVVVTQNYHGVEGLTSLR